MAEAPRWVLVAVGGACIALGLFLAVRPLTAISALGIYVGASCVISGCADLLFRRDAAGPWRVLEGLVWLVAGAFLLVWRAPGIRFLVILVAILLVVLGASRIARSLRERRLFSGIFGLAECAWGGLALAWPDVTLLVVAVLFGIRTVVFGAGQVLRAVPRRDVSEQPRRRPGRIMRSATAGVAMLLLGAAAAAGYVGMQFRDGVPVIDSSYASPATPPATPGELIRSEPYEGDLPEGMHAFRIAYSTTGSEGAPALASAVVAVSAQAQAPAPVIAWAHGTVGVARSCAPSLGPDAISEAGMPALEEIVARGWAVVATDYTGMGMAGDFPYLIGTDDEVIPVVHSRDYLSLLCAAASSVEAHFYEGRTHMSVLAEDSALPADLIAWTSARFAGRSSSVDSCP